MFFHCLLGLFQRVSGRPHDGNPLILEFWQRTLEGSQLLLTVRSPVGAVDQEDPPAASEALWRADSPMGDGVHSDCRQHLAAVEDSISRSRHCRLLSHLPKAAPPGACTKISNTAPPRVIPAGLGLGHLYSGPWPRSMDLALGRHQGRNYLRVTGLFDR